MREEDQPGEMHCGIIVNAGAIHLLSNHTRNGPKRFARSIDGETK
jgi:hypothetical protein